jgi:DNA-binding Lrp family transcriptional regulator
MSEKEIKKSKKEISSNDKKILNAIQGNALQSSTEISKKTNLSCRTVQKTISRLEKDQVIWGYTAIIDDDITGRKRFFILLKRSQKPASEDKVNIVVKRELRKLATKLGVELEGSYYINGLYDWLMCITADGINQVKRFCNSFGTVFEGSYVSDIHILEVMFPVERNGFDNPKLEGLREFF